MMRLRNEVNKIGLNVNRIVKNNNSLLYLFILLMHGRCQGNDTGDDTVGRLMHDFGCKEAKDMYYPELAKGVKHFKEEGGRERMCEAVEKYAKDYAENARLNSLLESIKKSYGKYEVGGRTGNECAWD